MSDNLFVYGTLLYDEVREFLLDPHMTSVIRLPGYRRVALKGEDYPTLIVDPNSEVEGKIVWKIAEKELEFLDKWEGSEYERVKGKKGKVSFWVYINDLRHGFGRHDFDGDWDSEKRKKAYLKQFHEQIAEDERR